MSERVRDLFELPAEVQKSAFVLKLAEGVRNRRETAGSYVVTPALAEAFDKALRLVGTALRDGRSQAAFLHGSFGSGKSHFMALLTLLLEGAEEGWRIPALHDLRGKHAFAGGTRLLQLHLHMIDKDSLEAAIFGRYLEYVRKEHPDAALPGLFADQQLFSDALAMMQQVGEAKFFAPMNQGAGAGGGSKFGAFAASRTWDRARFDGAAASTDPKVREELFSALVKSWFKAFALESRRFVDLETGLATLARHAAGLGFAGVVLFLDEIILWLASKSSHVEWMHNEVQKIVKLVESQEGHRQIPIVSFMARQRDLAEMVGHAFEGADNARLRDSLNFASGRYENIKLEDKNLPAIAEQRVLRPRNDASKAVLDAAFDRLKRQAGPAWQTLLGGLDGAAFRKLYPFSPALVEALVAMSNSLQRQRTAIRLLMELMVEHIPDLQLGDLVGVGDMFDVLAGGEDSADGIMKARFDEARRLFQYQFLPLIHEANGTGTPERCQRLRPEHPARLGCSGCPERACRVDNRLIKTVLVAALVPEVPALHDLTASRLVQLNHGTLKVPIPGTEASQVAKRLRDWASVVGQLHVGQQSDPTVRLQLEGVDLGPILDQAREHDSPGERQRVVRDLLFEAMGVDKVADWGKDHKVTWRGTTRPGHIRFGNVRKLGPEQLCCPDDHDWRLIVDYPFDEPGFGPHHDLEVVEKFREEGAGSWSLVWIPSFFSQSVNQMVGELAIVEHVLESPEPRRRYVSHLSVENQSRALTDLENLRSQKRNRLLQVLAKAYGIIKATNGDLDASQSVDDHLQVLKPGARIAIGVAANLESALDAFVTGLLEARWPRHPNLRKLSRTLVEDMVDLFGRLVDADDHRVPADRELVDRARTTLGELGLVRVTENAIFLREDATLQELEKRRQQKAAEQPTVAEVRRWIDEPGRMGLQDDALDLVVRCYARWAARTLVWNGQAYAGKPGQTLPAELVLEKPDLPGAAEWGAALNLASHFGVTLPGRALHADNLKKLELELSKRLKEVGAAGQRLPELLRQRLRELGLSVEDADRVTTAEAAARLGAAIAGQRPLEQVRALASFEPKTSARAMGGSMGSATRNVAALDSVLAFGVFAQLARRRNELAGADELLDQVAAVLRQDEILAPLAERLDALAHAGQELIVQPPEPAQPPPPYLVNLKISVCGRAAAREELKRLMEELRKADRDLEKADENVTVTGSCQLITPGQ